MELSEIYNRQNLNISLEVFPPENGDIFSLFEKLRILKKSECCFAVLNCDIQNASSLLSLEVLKLLLNLEYCAVARICPKNFTKEVLEHFLIQIENMGIENIIVDYSQDLGIDFVDIAEVIDFIYQKTTLAIGMAIYCEQFRQISEKNINGVKALFLESSGVNDYTICKNLIKTNKLSIPVILQLSEDEFVDYHDTLENLSGVHVLVNDKFGEVSEIMAKMNERNKLWKV